ncbi:Alpha/beta hydrolase family protein [Phycisphaerae bacterium RAS2]|nr:Alpha/beta hydrolase family protein [Phycisphaerae bacterium RAS2]
MLATSPFMLGGIWTAISHNWALFSILLTLLLLVIVPALVLAKYVRISLNIMKDTVPPLSVPQLCFDRIPGEERDVFAADGIRLRGIFMHPPPGVSRRGLVIFAPEFMSDRNSCARYCRPLLEAGYDVFSFDFRGHGESAKEEGFNPRQWASDREISDMTGVISFAEQWLEKMGYPVEIGLFGISRGACTSILVAAQNPVVKAIVVDGAFSSDHTLEHLMKRWAKIFAKVKFVYENHPPEFWRFLRWCLFVTCRFKFGCTYPSVKKALKRMPPRPLLFVHGQRDSYIPVEQSRMLYALAPQPKYLWIVQGAKHNQSVDMAPAEYARRTVQFFDQYLWRKAEPSNMYQPDRFVRMARSARDGVARSPRDQNEGESRVPASSANVTAEVASKSQN